MTGMVKVLIVDDHEVVRHGLRFMLAQEPGLEAQLGLREEPETTGLTPIEQEEIPAGKPLDEFLGTIAWPDAVAGCALTVERLMLPPSAEASVPEGLSEKKLTQWVA